MDKNEKTKNDGTPVEKEMQKPNAGNDKKAPTKGKTVFTVIVAVLALLMLGGALYLKSTADGSSQGSAKSEEKAELSAITLSQKEIQIPYMKTDIPSVVYTVDTAGTVQFYEFKGKSYDPIDPTGTMDVTVSLSGQQIPAKIYYVERDGVLTGYGVYTSQNAQTPVYIYDFVMFRVANLPSAYAADGKCLLLLHTDAQKVYTDNVVWEEAYILNRNDGTSTRFLNENNRTVNINGAVRPDFCMITDTELKPTTSVIPFFSCRNYEEQEDGSTPKDIYIKNGNNKDVDAVTDVLDTYAKPTSDGGFVYIKETDNGFNTMKYLNGQSSVINMFYGTYGSSYVRSGDWILSKEDGRLFNTEDNTVIETVGYKMNPLLFTVSPDGKYVVMLGTVTNAMDYRMYVFNTETKGYKVYTESNYAAHYNLRFSSNDTVTFYTIDANGAYINVVADVSKVK